jgi:hypothetical protein
MTKTWIENIIQQWQIEKLELNQGASIEIIIIAEKAIDFIFPEQFKELYLKVNGFKNNDWRTNMFSIWPIDRIIEEYNSSMDKNFVGFSDYLINSHQIGFTKNKKGIFKYHDKPDFIAETFEKGIQLINMDSELIYV